MNRKTSIARFLNDSGWLPGVTDRDVTFLAAGEYNENHLVQSHGGACVFRINHGSQLGQKRQIEYEFHVLQVLRDSGVTPLPWHVAQAPPAEYGFGGGVLLMEYLEGRPLEYESHDHTAAAILARVHSQPLPRELSGAQLPQLVTQAEPVQDIARESLELIERYPGHPLRDKRERLLRYHDAIQLLAGETAQFFAAEPLVLVNSEVNSHNFIINGQAPHGGWLVDWEKAVVSQRWQDLGHFLVPTTTQWKRDFVYDRHRKRAFLQTYLAHADLDMELDQALQLTQVLERTILLRALSWCYMAWHEYTSEDRALKNQDTFEKMEQYLGQMEELLA